MVWEIATFQWGLPSALLLAGLALSWMAERKPLSTPTAWLVMIAVFLGCVGVAHLAGRILWALATRGREEMG
jgi:hypothetical protein